MKGFEIVITLCSHEDETFNRIAVIDVKGADTLCDRIFFLFVSEVWKMSAQLWCKYEKLWPFLTTDRKRDQESQMWSRDQV